MLLSLTRLCRADLTDGHRLAATFAKPACTLPIVGRGSASRAMVWLYVKSARWRSSSGTDAVY